MITIKNLAKYYRTDTVETKVLDNISLTINKGDFVVIIGPSGAGKSTFLNILGLLENFDAGELELAGHSVASLNDKQLSALRSRHLGMIFQSFNLLPELTVEQNVQIPLDIQGIPKNESVRRVEKQLSNLGLFGRKDHKSSQLSGGQQQRVAIARALVGEPEILLADEPTGNLNSEMAKEIMGLLEQINQNGTTIIMVTHDLELARKASLLIELKDGRIITKTTKEVVSEEQEEPCIAE